MLVAAALLVASLVGPRLPSERDVELTLIDRAEITSVEIAWSARQGEAHRGGRWEFQRGSAPATLPAKVSLPDGVYDVDISVARGDDRRADRREVVLDGSGKIVLSIR